MQRQHRRILKGIKTVLSDLGLTLNEAKTRVVDARQESFNFLGFTIGMKRRGEPEGHPSLPSRQRKHRNIYDQRSSG